PASSASSYWLLVYVASRSDWLEKNTKLLISTAATSTYSSSPLVCLFNDEISFRFLFFSLNHSDVWKVSVFLCIVQTVTHHKFIRDFKTGVIHRHIVHHTAVRFIQKG